MSKINIKYMVCPRCIERVANILQDLKIPYSELKLGEVTLIREPNQELYHLLNKKLLEASFELLDDKETKLVNQVKTYLISIIHHNKETDNLNISNLLSQHLKKDYSIISKTFSKLEGLTIEKYIVNQKVERAKELLTYGELTISQIAVELDYSSTAHFSNQFKKITGMTPSQFKKATEPKRRGIDKL